MLRTWHRRLSWKLGYRRGEAGRAYHCPWWAHEDFYESAYQEGKARSFKTLLQSVDEPPVDEVYIRPLEIEASTDPFDYEIEDSPYWPPPPPSPPPELSAEEKAVQGRRSRGWAYLIVLPCWIFHKNDADPWPSRLHGHHNERPLKLDAISGRIYSIRTREHVQTLRSKELVRIQTALMHSKDFGDRARELIAPL